MPKLPAGIDRIADTTGRMQAITAGMEVTTGMDTITVTAATITVAITTAIDRERRIIMEAVMHNHIIRTAQLMGILTAADTMVAIITIAIITTIIERNATGG